MIAIGDVAGQHNCLERLIAQLPPNRRICLLGDLNCRGWESKAVIQWALDNDVSNGKDGRCITLDSNHGQMFVDWYKTISLPAYKPQFDDGLFTYRNPLTGQNNGGIQTLSSYGIDFRKFETSYLHNANVEIMGAIEEVLKDDVLKQHIDFLDKRPKRAQYKTYLCTHAPLNPNTTRSLDQFLKKGGGLRYPDVCDETRNNYAWNRNEPKRFHKDLPCVTSVYGHNSYEDIKLICKQYPNGIYVQNNEMFAELLDKNMGEIYGIGIDTSADSKITALDLETMKFYSEFY